jgi:hypothetical protein
MWNALKAFASWRIALILNAFTHIYRLAPFRFRGWTSMGAAWIGRCARKVGGYRLAECLRSREAEKPAENEEHFCRSLHRSLINEGPREAWRLTRSVWQLQPHRPYTLRRAGTRQLPI